DSQVGNSADNLTSADDNLARLAGGQEEARCAWRTAIDLGAVDLGCLRIDVEPVYEHLAQRYGRRLAVGTDATHVVLSPHDDLVIPGSRGNASHECLGVVLRSRVAIVRDFELDVRD